MGYMRHHAIICTCFQKDVAHQIRDHAESVGCCVSEVSPEVINGYSSFCVFPDGSKEGWIDSEEGDHRRSVLIEFMAKLREAGRYCDWAEVQFGDDERKTVVTRHSDEPDRIPVEE